MTYGPSGATRHFDRRQIHNSGKCSNDQAAFYNSRQLLALMLSICQSAGIHSYLIEKGVGGAFAGVCATGNAIFWQPDTEYRFYDSLTPPSFKDVGQDGVIVMSRLNVLVTRSSAIAGTTIVFANKSHPADNTLYRARLAAKSAKRSYLRKFVDYVVFLDTAIHRVTVLEFLGHPVHKRFAVKRLSEQSRADRIRRRDLQCDREFATGKGCICGKPADIMSAWGL